MIGGVFELSNSATFSTGSYVSLPTLDTLPAHALNILTVPAADTKTKYRYVRYVSPNGSYGDIADMMVFGG